jgi:hypothetical protein
VSRRRNRTTPSPPIAALCSGSPSSLHSTCSANHTRVGAGLPTFRPRQRGRRKDLPPARPIRRERGRAQVVDQQVLRGLAAGAHREEQDFLEMVLMNCLGAIKVGFTLIILTQWCYGEHARSCPGLPNVISMLLILQIN